MKQVPLTNSQKVAWVDDEDYDIVMQNKWRFGARKYAIRTVVENGKYRLIYMHRAIMGEPSQLVDHRDDDGLNNQRSNLRLCSNQQNLWNQGKKKLKRATTSLFKGVRLEKGKWRADVQVNGKQEFIGYFPTEHSAALAYDLWAKDVFGEYARTNFTPVKS